MQNFYKFIWASIGIIIILLISIRLYQVRYYSMPWPFAPNVVLVQKAPIAVEILQTDERVQWAQNNTAVIDYQDACLGSAIRQQQGTLYLIKKEVFAYEYTVVDEIPPSSQLAYQPNAMAYRRPVPAQLIDSLALVKKVKHTPSIYRYEYAEQGAVLSQSMDKLYINLIPKNIVNHSYTVIDLRDYLNKAMIDYRSLQMP